MLAHTAIEVESQPRTERVAGSDGASPRPKPASDRLRVLFLVEGFTDIRFVTGLSKTFELTMVVPARQYTESGLNERVAAARCGLSVVEIPGGRLAFQLRSLKYVWRNARRFDVILAQEMMRGALSANLGSLCHRVPVVSYVATSPVEYFRCRYERGQIGPVKAAIGELAIRTLLSVNGRLCSCCVAVGPYLCRLIAHYCRRSELGAYYGIDTDSFRPTDPAERISLRRRLDLPLDRFIILFSSRISHEKDPETLLRAVSRVRDQGLDAVVLNLGGGYRQFIDLAHRLGLPETGSWVIAHPAVHPVTEVFDYYKAVDLVVQSSLAEGAGLSPLEALACGTPVVATAVGGMTHTLEGRAALVPRRAPSAMADAILWAARHRDEARRQALYARDYVVRDWDRERAFIDLERIIRGVCTRDSIGTGG